MKCGKDATGKLVTHIQVHHMEGRMMLHCSLCPYSQKCSRGNMKTHFATAHPGRTLRFKDAREEFAEETEKLRRECFPDAKYYRQTTEKDVATMEQDVVKGALKVIESHST